MASAAPPAHRIKCVSNLKNIGLAFRIYANDNDGHFPAPHLSNEVAVAALTPPTHFSFLSNELSTPRLLFCSSEKSRKTAETFATLSNQNISYFSSLNADDADTANQQMLLRRPPDMWLAGDRNLIINGAPAQPGQITLSPTDQVSWSQELHNGNGNVAMNDGSVQQFSTLRLKQSLSDHTTTNLLLFP